MVVRNVNRHQNVLDTYDEFLGLPEGTKDMEFFAEGKYQNAWKLHLYTSPEVDVKNPTIQDTVKYFMDHNIQFKMGNCGDETKKFTIYVGDRDEATKLSQTLDETFGSDYAKLSSPETKVLYEDQEIAKNIGIRFEGVNGDHMDSLFTSYGCQGTNSLKGSFHEDNQDLNALSAHCFMAENCGYKYLGQSYKEDKWDKKIFGDKFNQLTLPEIEDYVSQKLNILHKTSQKNYIKENNLVEPSDGVALSVYDVLGYDKGSSQAQERDNTILAKRRENPILSRINLPEDVSIKISNLGIISEADNVLITKDENENKVIKYKKDGEVITSCTLSQDGKRYIKLFHEDKTLEYMINSTEAKKRYGNVYISVGNDRALYSNLHNIVNQSQAIWNNYIKGNYDKQISSEKKSAGSQPNASLMKLMAGLRNQQINS